MTIRDPYILSHLPFGELTNDVELALARFMQEVERLNKYYDKLLREGGASEQYIIKIGERLGIYQDVFEFCNQLVGNVNLFDNMYVLSAMEDTKHIAGNRREYGFSIYFNHTNPPIVLID